MMVFRHQGGFNSGNYSYHDVCNLSSLGNEDAGPKRYISNDIGINKRWLLTLFTTTDLGTGSDVVVLKLRYTCLQ